MAYNIKGITVKINGDTTGLQKELSKIKAETAGLDKTMNNLKRSMKGLDGSNYRSMATYQQLVATKMQSLNKQLGVQQKAILQMPDNLANWKSELNRLTTAQSQFQAKLDSGAKLTKKQAKEFQNNKIQIKALEDNINSYDQKVQTLTANSLAMENNLRSLSKEFISLNPNVLKAVSSLDSASVKLDKFSQATRGISLGSAVAIAGATAAAISFEDAWTGVLKTTEGTPAQLEAINNGIKELATSTSSSYEAIAHYAELAGQLGVATDSIVGFTETVTMLGDTTNLIGDEAAQQIAKFANIMVSTEGQTNEYFSKLGSSIVDLGNNFATTEADIMNMSMRLATAGRQVGFTSQDVLGLATALSSVGIEAAAGGGSMSKMLKQVELAVATNSDKLQAFAQVSGMTAQEFIQLWGQDAPTAFGKLLDGIGNSENITKTLNDLGIVEVRMSNAMGALAQNTDLYWSALGRANSAFEQNHAMVAEAEKRYGTLKSTLIQTWESIKQAADELGQAFAPKLEELANVVKDVAEWFTNLDDSTKDTIANMLLFGAALSPVSKGLSLLASGGSKVIKTFGKASSGFQSLMSNAKNMGQVFDFANQTLKETGSTTKTVGVMAGQAKMSFSSLVSTVGKGNLIFAGVTVGIGALVLGLTQVYNYSKKAREAFSEQLASQDALYASTLTLIDGMDEYNSEIDELSESAEKTITGFNESSVEADMLVDRIGQLLSVEGRTTSQNELLYASIDALNSIYPDLGLYLDENSGKLKDNEGKIYENAQALEKRIEALKEQAKQEAYASAITDTTKKLAKQQMKYDDITASLQYLNKERNALLAEDPNLEKYGAAVGELSNKIVNLTNEYAGMSEQITNTNLELLKAQNYMETGGYEQIGETLKTTLQGIVTSAQQTGIQIPTAIRDGIMNGSVSFQEASNFTASMLTFQSAVNNGTWAGTAIPVSLMNGLIAGAPNIATATQYLNNLLTFNQGIQNAGVAGDQIPQKIVEGIANGTINVETANSDLASLGVDRFVEKYSKIVDDASEKSKEAGTAMGDGSSNASSSAGKMAKSGRDSAKKQFDGMVSDAETAASSVTTIVDNAIAKIASLRQEASKPVTFTVNYEEHNKPAKKSVEPKSLSMPRMLANVASTLPQLARDYVTPYVETPATQVQTIMSNGVMQSRNIAMMSSGMNNLSKKLDQFIEAFNNAQLLIQLQPQELDGEIITDTVDEVHTIRELLMNTGKGEF